jgi:hypothetical protein
MYSISSSCKCLSNFNSTFVFQCRKGVMDFFIPFYLSSIFWTNLDLRIMWWFFQHYCINIAVNNNIDSQLLTCLVKLN